MTNQQNRLVTSVATLFFLPLLANAHPGHLAASGWDDGFMHPLQGADHLLAMILVGMWAAQQRGRAVWIIPMTFVGIMAMGGLAGAVVPVIPGVEATIVASLGVFLFLVARRVQPTAYISASIAAFFAFFHGFAHGAEMPGTAKPLAFGAGFLVATLILHATGWAAMRVAVWAVKNSRRASTVQGSPMQLPKAQ